jgi:hypothetical protein
MTSIYKYFLSKFNNLRKPISIKEIKTNLDKDEISEYFIVDKYTNDIYLREYDILPNLKNIKQAEISDIKTLEQCKKDFEEIINIYHDYNEFNYKKNREEYKTKTIEQENITNIKELLIFLVNYRNNDVFIGTHWDLYNYYINCIDEIFLSFQTKYNFKYILSKKLESFSFRNRLNKINLEDSGYYKKQICHHNAKIIFYD